ncbi:MAG: outer membrane protein assembly factor BamD [Calditrichaeota bacterium]|nr:MAG: outer membrane protein assembly factor BamD [Calditrichota bacterium]
MNLKRTIVLNCVLAALILSWGCHSYNVRPDVSAEERFEIAKKMFSRKHYFEAKNQFKILTLNNPGLPFMDEAQFLLAECHFHLKEYILAADEYNRLLRLYPKSQWLDDAEFMIGMCNYKLSPKPSLDQKYTVEAVNSFQRFLEDFPKSDLVPKAEKLLKTCRTKLAKKEYKAGELYRKLHYYEAAVVYFSSVIDNYYDTEYVKPALYWKGECLYRLAKNVESMETFQELVRKYPTSQLVVKARQRMREIEAELLKTREANGIAPDHSQTKN